MTKNETRIRDFFSVETDEERYRTFFEVVNSVLQDNNGGFDSNVTEITNHMIAHIIKFEGLREYHDDEDHPYNSEINGYDNKYSFCESSDYAAKILKDEKYSIDQLQKELSIDIDVCDDDIAAEANYFR